MTSAEVDVMCAFLVCGRLPVLLGGVYRAIVVYADGKKVGCGFLRFGGLDGQHGGGD